MTVPIARVIASHIAHLYACFIRTGQSTGIVQLFDRRSLDVVCQQKIHKGKITHVEFSKHHEYLLATASVGHEVKIWDVRNMKNANSKVDVHFGRNCDKECAHN